MVNGRRQGESGTSVHEQLFGSFALTPNVHSKVNTLVKTHPQRASRRYINPWKLKGEVGCGAAETE